MLQKASQYPSSALSQHNSGREAAIAGLRDLLIFKLGALPDSSTACQPTLETIKAWLFVLAPSPKWPHSARQGPSSALPPSSVTCPGMRAAMPGCSSLTEARPSLEFPLSPGLPCGHHSWIAPRDELGLCTHRHVQQDLVCMGTSEHPNVLWPDPESSESFCVSSRARVSCGGSGKAPGHLTLRRINSITELSRIWLHLFKSH